MRNLVRSGTLLGGGRRSTFYSTHLEQANQDLREMGLKENR